MIKDEYAKRKQKIYEKQHNEVDIEMIDKQNTLKDSNVIREKEHKNNLFKSFLKKNIEDNYIKVYNQETEKKKITTINKLTSNNKINKIEQKKENEKSLIKDINEDKGISSSNNLNIFFPDFYQVDLM
jgi:hypothetical protein